MEEIRSGFGEEWPREFWPFLKDMQDRELFGYYTVTSGGYLRCNLCKAEIWTTGPCGERLYGDTTGPMVQENVMQTHLQAHGLRREY